MTEYTPSDEELARAWKHYRDSMDDANAWVREDDAEPAEDEAYRAIAHIRADATRGAAQIAGTFRTAQEAEIGLKAVAELIAGFQS